MGYFLFNACYGSFGWSEEAEKEIERRIELQQTHTLIIAIVGNVDPGYTDWPDEYDYDHDYDYRVTYRTCSIAHELFDEWGSKRCSGRYSKLVKLKVPDELMDYVTVNNDDGHDSIEVNTTRLYETNMEDLLDDNKTTPYTMEDVMTCRKKILCIQEWDGRKRIYDYGKREDDDDDNHHEEMTIASIDTYSGDEEEDDASSRGDDKSESEMTVASADTETDRSVWNDNYYAVLDDDNNNSNNEDADENESNATIDSTTNNNDNVESDSNDTENTTEYDERMLGVEKISYHRQGHHHVDSLNTYMTAMTPIVTMYFIMMIIMILVQD